MGATNDNAIEVEDAPVILREESEERLNLQDLPDVESPPSDDIDSLFVAEDEGPRRSKRPRTTTNTSSPPESSLGFEPPLKRSKNVDAIVAEEGADDKKKMVMVLNLRTCAMSSSQTQGQERQRACTKWRSGYDGGLDHEYADAPTGGGWMIELCTTLKSRCIPI